MIKRSRKLRQAQTKAESLLWNELRNRKLNGFKFRRQHVVNNFILDFYCLQAFLGIEIDGGIHDLPSQKQRDFEREMILKDFGIHILRFRNEAIYYSIEEVKRTISTHCKRRT